jgi:hypothetical protein
MKVNKIKSKELNILKECLKKNQFLKEINLEGKMKSII